MNGRTMLNHPLSPRETQVCGWLAQGLTNREIAEHLFLAENTVKTHVGRIMAKLDVSSRAQVVTVFYERALADRCANCPRAKADTPKEW